MARKKSARARVRSAVKSVKKAVHKAEKGWSTRTSHSDGRLGDTGGLGLYSKNFAPVKTTKTQNAFANTEGWVSKNKGLVAGAVAVAAVIAVSVPAIASASTPPNPTPTQVAQAQADAQAASARNNALKIAAGLFAVTAAATLTYAVVADDAPPQRPVFRPASIY